MSKNKNLIARYQEIVRLLNVRHGAVKKIELIRQCGVGERTIKGDIIFLRTFYGAKIKYDRKEEGYRLVEPFEIPTHLPLTFHDYARLKMAVTTLSKLKHLDIFKDLEATFDKIEKAVKIRTTSPSAPNHIFFEPVPFYQGTELISVFLNAVDLTKAVRFDYQSFKSPEIRTHEIHPYFLQEFTHRWYVVGWSPQYQAIMPFALERICGEPEILPSSFEIPKEFNRNDYFKNTYGMTRYSEAEVENVILSFSPIQAKYFRSKPFHDYEIVSETSDSLVVKMRLVVNYELKRKIISMGSEVKVLQPALLIEAIKGLFRDTLLKYER